MTDMQSPINDKPLSARLFSVEMVVWLIAVVFSFGVGYSSLAKDAEGNTESINQIRKAQAKVVEDISEIKASVAAIRATQHTGRASTDARMRRQESDIGRILDILQRNNGNNH